MVKYGKVMQNLPKIRAILEVEKSAILFHPLPPPPQGNVGPLHLKNAYIKLPTIILKYVCRIYSEDIIISKRCLFLIIFTSFYV